jgi:hypothetical protein
MLLTRRCLHIGTPEIMSQGRVLHFRNKFQEFGFPRLRNVQKCADSGMPSNFGRLGWSQIRANMSYFFRTVKRARGSWRWSPGAQTPQLPRTESHRFPAFPENLKKGCTGPASRWLQHRCSCGVANSPSYLRPSDVHNASENLASTFYIPGANLVNSCRGRAIPAHNFHHTLAAHTAQAAKCITNRTKLRALLLQQDEICIGNATIHAQFLTGSGQDGSLGCM